MPSAQHLKSIRFPQYSFSSNETAVSFDSIAVYEITLAVVDPQNVGTLTTRTDADTGVATLVTGHSITTGEVVDVYWAAGVRYGMTATVSVNAVTVDGGAGDDLPSQDTACTVVEQTSITVLNLDGDNAKMIGVFYRNASDTGAKAHINFQDSGAATIREVDLVHETANGGLDEILNISGGDTNTYTGNPVTQGKASHDSVTAAAVLYVLAGIDATP